MDYLLVADAQGGLCTVMLFCRDGTHITEAHACVLKTQTHTHTHGGPAQSGTNREHHPQQT